MTAYQVLENAVKENPGRIVKAVLTSPDGKQETYRFAQGAVTGGLVRIKKGARRKGFYVLDNALDGLSVKIVKEPEKEECTVAEKYAGDIRKWAAYVLKNCHPNVWTELQKEAATVTPESLALYIAARNAYPDPPEQFESNDDYFAYHKALPTSKQFGGMPEVDVYKTLTIAGCQHPNPEYLSNLLKGHLDRKEEFRYHWYANYDYTISGKVCSDGLYKAWLSQEFKGCGNGHYWLLISDKHAIFAEDD